MDDPVLRPVAPSPQRAQTRRRVPASFVVGVILLALYAAVVAVVVLSPVRVDGDSKAVYRALIDGYAAGLPRWVTYDVVQTAANVVLAFPLGFFIAMMLPRRRWWVAAVVCIVLFAAVETAQLVLPQRMPSVVDWLANSAGGLLGAVSWWVVAPRRRRGTLR